MKRITSGLLAGLVLSSTAIALMANTANARGNQTTNVPAAKNYISLSAAVNGRNVKVVNHSKGKFIDRGNRKWEEVGNNGARFNFRETNRDAWSVYLVDATRNVKIQLDLFRKKIVYSDSRNKFDLYTITSASKDSYIQPSRPVRMANAIQLAYLNTED